MFRNPRENAALATPVKPSTGRPPTPPSGTTSRSTKQTATIVKRTSVPANSNQRASATMASRRKPQQQRLNFKPMTEAEKRAAAKSAYKPNKSILQFFNKTDPPPKGLVLGSSIKNGDDSLFFDDETESVNEDLAESVDGEVDGRSRSKTPDAVWGSPSKDDRQEDDSLRFNEKGGMLKRTKLADQESNDECTPPPMLSDAVQTNRLGAPIPFGNSSTTPGTQKAGIKPKRKGPFIDSSDDSSDEEVCNDNVDKTMSRPVDSDSNSSIRKSPITDIAENEVKIPRRTENENEVDSSEQGMIKQDLDSIEKGKSRRFEPPTLLKQSTSFFDPDGFDGIGDFNDEEFADQGEEYLERKWTEEQNLLEMAIENGEFRDDYHDSEPESKSEQSLLHGNNSTEEKIAQCPICSTSFSGVSDNDASIHVNNCLDGNPSPLPSAKEPSLKSEQLDSDVPIKVEPGVKPVSPLERFQRAAIARPGQENPFNLSMSTNVGSSSAFSKIMSGHAEDAAWATAAANEVASRGKPAYKRTCPFYKILPGFFICVDAFRYGAVKGCNAYFLSHFHSDHYIGLTSSWCHGPIYCSKVTGNLVRQQLKVDPKWVVDLEFEKKEEVPGTQGVFVTMIPANHCPGSSLFLYEKVLGKGPNPKIQRILHCGDFRACPAHVQHPLLRPEVQDLVTGKSRQQRIDVCYLDTTYLTPKYAFPSQEDVIQACADMCISLSGDFVNPSDAWETTKRERAGTVMTKFVTKDTLPNNLSDHSKAQAPRGRLLVVIGTYSIGKERICLGIARALNCKIYAPPAKQRICACLEDPELMSRLTSDPLEAQIHMQMLMEIRAETLADYLTSFKSHFTRVVGFRPSGWNYRPPKTRGTESPLISSVLHSEGWKSRFGIEDLVPQRGSTKDAACYGVPYSEHSSFRELTMFCCALRIGRVVPTVNVGSQKSREKMRSWIDKWEAEKKKTGLFKVEDGAMGW